MLDSHQLNIFLKASETLNFTQAAKQLNMTQPSVSQHIQSLENHFKTKLFFRTGSKLQLTEAGMALVPMAKEMVDHSIRIDEAMSSLEGEIYGSLLIGCSTTPGKYILPKLLAKFHNSYPRVSVTYQVTPQGKVMEMLCNGQIHFMLAGFARKECNDVELFMLYCDQILLIAPSDHAWSFRGTIQIKDLINGEFILREEESGTYQNVQEALRNKNIDIRELQNLLTLGNSEAIALAVREGLGVGFVSESVVASMVQEGIQVIDIEGLDICRDIYFCRQRKRPSSRAQDVFWDFITGSLTLEDENIAEEILLEKASSTN